MTSRRHALRRALDWGLWIAAISLLVWRFGPQVGAAVGLGGERRPAPDFVLETLAGDSVRLSELRGQVVLLNFWATWCAPCRVEMPWFQQLERELGARGFVVVGASTDRGSRDAVRAFLLEREIEYTVGIAPASLVRAYGGIRGIPTSFLIDRQGRIRHTVTGIFAEPALRAAVQRLLAEP